MRRMLEIVLCNLPCAERSCVMRVVSAVRRYATFSDSVLVSRPCKRTQKSPEASGVTAHGATANTMSHQGGSLMGSSIPAPLHGQRRQHVASVLGPVVSAPSASTLRAHLDSTPAG